jgi:adenine phosphoribosyltransferase
LNADDLKNYIYDVPDFPKPGVVFKDITPLVTDTAAFNCTIELMAETLQSAQVEEIIAIESRGFIFGAAIAGLARLPLHLVRKPGKLPRETIGVDYELEYGTDRVEIHRDALTPGRRYGIVDDVIATGGTAWATAQLVQETGGQIGCCLFVIELGFLGGRKRLNGLPVESLIVYD